MAKWSRVSRAFAVQVLAAHLAKWLAWICCSVQLAYKHFQPCSYAGRGFYKVDRRLAFFNNAQRAPEKPMRKSTCHCAMPWSVLGKICTTDLWNEKERTRNRAKNSVSTGGASSADSWSMLAAQAASRCVILEL